MKIKIDYREKKVLKYFKDMDVSIENLPIGDIVYGELCIERKSASDFVSSISDGRLFTQAENMVENYKNPVILIESDLSKISKYLQFSHRKMKMNHVYGVIARLVISYRIPVIFCNTREGFVKFVRKLIEKADKSSSRKKVVKKKVDDPALNMIMSVKGIGLKKGERILKHYGSICKINLESTPEGVSEKDIKKILEVLKRE